MVINIGRKRTTKEIRKDGLREGMESVQSATAEDSSEEEVWEVSKNDLEVAFLLYEAFKPWWGC